MSIPPLVCSTPPPPEQCEDDKDPEDFDLSYNLSQEEDDDRTEYNFGNYSPYNIYPTKSDNVNTEKWPSHFNEMVECEQQDNVQSEDITNHLNFISNDNLFSEDIPKFEENILEDLNLKVEADDVLSNSTCTKQDETESKVYDTEESSGRNTRIQDQGGTDTIKNKEENITIGETLEIVESVSICDNNEHVDNEEVIHNVYNELTVTYENKSNNSFSDQEQTTSSSNMIPELKHDITEKMNNRKDQADQLNDDEFGDFEDFQFKSSSNNKVLPLSSENPWDSNTNESIEFGAFTANFDSNVQELEEISNTQNDNKSDSAINDDEDDDDDFGDFDDFKSSSNIPEDTEDANNVTATSSVPVLNFHTQDNELQIVDSINNVLTSIFMNEISEPDNSLDEKLELYLSETWGHLIDIDVRQPYMVNWNNSLGQKTLLKALCIDSRNILFGHKWNYNMPKYAANLSVAPLQPQKQQAQSTALNTETVVKAPEKETGTWVDPFTPDGQESCNSETESKEVDAAKRPIDLDVFENETSTKLNKIYSNTVQPLRHINLPDTHIFTPTDSETPRSKTIHYDDGPALVPAPVIETDKNEPEQVVREPGNMESDNEYWEFQDFKGTNTQTPVLNAADQETPEEGAAKSTSDSLPKAGITYQTQILQPIKIEPIMPTLNWPDPGEVKETFDDFSEFISSTSWNNEKDNGIQDLQNEDKKIEDCKNIKTEKIDDEFETFQSAPAKTSVLEFAAPGSVNRNLENPSTNIIGNNDEIKISHSEKLHEIPTDILSSTLQNNVLGLQDFNFAQPSGFNSTNYQANSNILQPTSSITSGTGRIHQSSGQILQPLSLESYSQINWPNPGIDLQDLSRFNPVNSLQSLKSEAITGGNSKSSSPAHNSVHSQNDMADDDIWGDFVSSTPKPQTSPKKPVTFADDDEWTDFVSSPSVRPQNGLNTISLNVHTNLSMQKPTSHKKISTRNNQLPLDIPTLNYITPKSNNRVIYTEKHFQNL